MSRTLQHVSVASGMPPSLITHNNRQSLAPFVLFDASGTIAATEWLNIDWHPHSGVATVTLPFSANLHHADSAGHDGVIYDGGMQWMASGGGIWHNERYEPVNNQIGIHQLWVLLPPEEETADVNYFNLQPGDIPVTGNTRVLLGEFNGTKAARNISQDVTYLEVTLSAGETWTFTPKGTQTRGFVFPRSGTLSVANTKLKALEFGQLSEGTEQIKITAQTKSTFVVGTAKPWEHSIIHEYGQMHTTAEALAEGKVNIAQLGKKLQHKLSG